MLESLYQNFLKSGKVSTDTRKIEPGSIFFALKGPNFNANALAEEALNKGAMKAVIDEESFKKDDRYILVDDVLTTLQDLARHHRKHLTIPVIGLTGSNGKTTTKELIHAVLGKKFRVLATRGNLNNHIGVPLTILSITPSHEMAIIEMGANHQGEIAVLSDIAAPSHGLITNIGKAHLEGFGGIEGVIRGKSELYQYLIKTNGVVWINSNSPELFNMSKRFTHPLFYPNEGDYYHCQLVATSPTLRIKAESGNEIQTQLVGAYNFENIAVALCIGKYFEVPAELAEEAVSEYNPQNNRSQLIRKDGKMIIMDAYNANPSSMAGALDNLEASDGKYKWAILGDMKELGSDSVLEHTEIGKKLNAMNLEKIFLLGPEMKAAAAACPKAEYFEDKASLKNRLQSENAEGRTILLKGSRSMGLEECLEDL